MTPTQISDKIKTSGLVPVFNHDDPAIAKRVIKACYDAGLRVFEWTDRGPLASRIFNEIQPYLRDECPEMTVGAGTIFNSDMARRYVSLGADFIVSPVLDPDVSQACRQLGVLWIPGTGTATEIHQALKWGAEIVKVFPGGAAGGPAFIKAVLATMPQAQLMPTGGVDITVENLRGWFEAGVCCVGMGSKLFTRELLENEDNTDLIKSISNTLKIIKQVRKKT